MRTTHARPDAFEVAGERRAEDLGRRLTLLRVLMDRQSDDVLQLRVEPVVGVDRRADLAFPRPPEARDHRIEHGAEREQIGPRVRRLAGELRVGKSPVSSAGRETRPSCAATRRTTTAKWTTRMIGQFLLRPVQDVHRVEIDVEDRQPMQLGQRRGHLDRRPEMQHHLVRPAFRADGGEQRQFIEERADQVGAAVAQAAVRLHHREVG